MPLSPNSGRTRSTCFLSDRRKIQPYGGDGGYFSTDPKIFSTLTFPPSSRKGRRRFLFGRRAYPFSLCTTSVQSCGKLQKVGGGLLPVGNKGGGGLLPVGNKPPLSPYIL